ncbi:MULTISPECIES: hypothetical protein [Alicyclobacillus]|nr:MULTISPECIES: hypothetical protein [Alicyclobacillus]
MSKPPVDDFLNIHFRITALTAFLGSLAEEGSTFRHVEIPV